MRWIALLLLLGVLVAGAACEEVERHVGGGGRRHLDQEAVEATDTPPALESTVGFYRLPAGEPIEEKEAQRLRSLAPTEDEVGAAFPDLAPFEQELRGDLGQEYEHVDLAKHGFVAGYVAFYRPSDTSHGAYITFALFHDASGASSALTEMLAVEFGAASTFEVGEGDESYGLTSPGPIVLLRQDRVAAFIAMIQPGGEDRREGMRQLSRDVAGKIEDALAQ